MKAPRRKASTARRLRPFWILLLVIGVAAAGLGAFVAAWPGFAPKKIEVQGNRVVPVPEIVSRAEVSGRTNMWLQDTRAMAQRIEAIPYVAAASVYRIPPATVLISVRERAPFAVVRSGDETAVVDRDLRVLQIDDEQPPLPVLALKSGVPLAIGQFVRGDATLLRDDYDAMIAAHVVPLELSFDRFGGLIATVRGGVQILFGDDADFDKKLALVNPVLSQLARDRRRVAAIDLRAPSTPVLVFRKP